MPTVQVTATVEVAEGTTLAALEDTVALALNSAGRKLITKAMPILEQGALARSGGARQRPEPRYVLTRFGEVRFSRWKVKTASGYDHPLDQALGLHPHQSLSPSMAEEFAFFGQMLPFRQAATLLSRLLRISIDHRRVWRAARAAGSRVRLRWDRMRATLFEDGALPRPGGPHRMVVLEADGTGIRSRDGPAEAKLLIWYAGKRIRRSGTGHRRRRAFLLHKGAYAAVQEVDGFGQTAFCLAERAVGLTRARFLLGISDGGGWLPGLFAEWLRVDAHQLDHFHGRRRIQQTPGLPSEVSSRWWSLAVEGRLEEIVAEARVLIRRGVLDPEEARMTVAYIAAGAPKLHAASRLKDRGATGELCSKGSGAIEHNVDLVVARRLKRRGMTWSREGASDILALRCAAMDEATWKEVVAQGDLR
jgi:hypothetical protein